MVTNINLFELIFKISKQKKNLYSIFKKRYLYYKEKNIEVEEEPVELYVLDSITKLHNQYLQQKKTNNVQNRKVRITTYMINDSLYDKLISNPDLDLSQKIKMENQEVEIADAMIISLDIDFDELLLKNIFSQLN